MQQPKLILHGGAGGPFNNTATAAKIRQSLYEILEAVYRLLVSGASAMDAVVRGCQLLEDDPLFNAGTGSVLQSDGQIRMSAALMDGAIQRFSGVINTSWVQHPIYLAQALQAEKDRVLSEDGTVMLARELKLPVYNPLTEPRLREWLQKREARRNEAIESLAESGHQINAPRRGTVGVVALDTQGRLAAGTSTGGKGFERIGRVSDSAMPAGNYATRQAAVSCTGIGEDIIDECLAARIVVRVIDGLPLANAFHRSLSEASSNQRDLAAIGIDASGAIAWGKTSKTLRAAYHDGNTAGDTLDMGEGVEIGSA